MEIRNYFILINISLTKKLILVFHCTQYHIQWKILQHQTLYWM